MKSSGGTVHLTLKYDNVTTVVALDLRVYRGKHD